MSDLERRLRAAQLKSAQAALGSNILLEAADRIAELEAENARIRKSSLLRKANEPLLDGCYCTPGKCAAPRPNWCRDFNKRDALLGGGDE